MYEQVNPCIVPLAALLGVTWWLLPQSVAKVLGPNRSLLRGLKPWFGVPWPCLRGPFVVQHQWRVVCPWLQQPFVVSS